MAEIEKREAELTANETRKAELAAPATAEELQAFDLKHTSWWFRKNVGRASFDDLSEISDDEFRAALASIPKTGWPDGRDDGAHLRDLRKHEPEPEVEIEPDPDNTGLRRLLAGTA